MPHNSLKNYHIDSNDIRILQAIDRNPGIDTVQLASKINAAKIAISIQCEKLEKDGYIQRSWLYDKVHKHYLNPDVDLNVIMGIKDLTLKDNLVHFPNMNQQVTNDTTNIEYWKSRLSEVQPKPKETLIDLATYGESSVKSIMARANNKVTGQTIDSRLRLLSDLKLITRNYKKGRYFYSLEKGLTREIISEFFGIEIKPLRADNDLVDDSTDDPEVNEKNFAVLNCEAQPVSVGNEPLAEVVDSEVETAVATDPVEEGMNFLLEAVLELRERILQLEATVKKQSATISEQQATINRLNRKSIPAFDENLKRAKAIINPPNPPNT